MTSRTAEKAIALKEWCDMVSFERLVLAGMPEGPDRERVEEMLVTIVGRVRSRFGLFDATGSGYLDHDGVIEFCRIFSDAMR